MPEYQAPPPPAKKGPHFHSNDPAKNSPHDSVFEVYDHPPNSGNQETYDRPRLSGQELYDRPRSGELGGSQASLEDDDIYKVPPKDGGQALRLRVKKGSASSDVDLHVAVPLPSRRHSPRSSLSDRPDSVASLGRPMTENYDVPPPRRTSTSSKDGRESDMAPPRPLKPQGLRTQSPYQNLSASSKAYENSGLNTVPSAPPKTCSAVLSYDVPRASTMVSPPRDSSALALAPPPPAPSQCGPSDRHSYVNSVAGSGNSPAVPPRHNTYLPMKNGERGEPDLAYADMTGVALADQGKVPPVLDMNYADMSGAGGGKGEQDLYQVPPVAPRPPARAGTMPSQRIQGAVAGENSLFFFFFWGGGYFFF